jgi:hypothetical protein
MIAGVSTRVVVHVTAGSSSFWINQAVTRDKAMTPTVFTVAIEHALALDSAAGEPISAVCGSESLALGT